MSIFPYVRKWTANQRKRQQRNSGNGRTATEERIRNGYVRMETIDITDRRLCCDVRTGVRQYKAAIDRQQSRWPDTDTTLSIQYSRHQQLYYDIPAPTNYIIYSQRAVCVSGTAWVASPPKKMSWLNAPQNRKLNQNYGAEGKQARSLPCMLKKNRRLHSIAFDRFLHNPVTLTFDFSTPEPYHL